MSQPPENQQQYGSILTILGESAEQNGKLKNKQITFTHIAIGDANDTYVQPDRKQTALVNELARIPVNSVDVLQPTPDSTPMLKVEAILTDDVNDLIIREFAAVATFDGNTYFHAVGNCARIYVPAPVNNGNVSTPVTLEMIFVITSAEPIVEIDPNVVTASREYVHLNVNKSQEQLGNISIWPSDPRANIAKDDVIKFPTTAVRKDGCIYVLDKTMPENAKVENVGSNFIQAGGIKYNLGGGLDKSIVMAAGSRQTRPLSERFGDTVNVLDFGAEPTGVVDATEYINAAIQTGKVPFFPDGKYLIQGEVRFKNGYIANQCPFLIDGGVVYGAETNLNFVKPSFAEGFNEKINCCYDMTKFFTDAINVNTFESGNIPIILEDGDFIVRVEYTGIFNQVKLQIRGADNEYLSQQYNNTSGSDALSDRYKTHFSGDNVNKVAYLRFYTSGDFKQIRSVKLSLNTNAIDQDVLFSIVNVSFGFVNKKNLTRVQANLNIGRNYVSIRGSWNDDGSIDQRFYDTDQDLEAMKNEVDRHRKVFDLDGVRLPIYYKNMTNDDGTTKKDVVLRVKRMLDYINLHGLSAIVTLNHFFHEGYRDKIVTSDDIETADKRQKMADRAAAVVKELRYHPTVFVWEIENEVNYAHGVIYDDISFDGLVDYIGRMNKTIKRSVKNNGLYEYYNEIPTSISFSGTSAHQYYIKEFSTRCDILDIHAYGTGLSRLYDLSNPVISTECEKPEELVNQKRYSAIICPWHQYVVDVSPSYSQGLVEEYRKYDGVLDEPVDHVGFFTHPNNFAYNVDDLVKPKNSNRLLVLSTTDKQFELI